MKRSEAQVIKPTIVRIFILLVLLISPKLVFSQNGPAGVGDAAGSAGQPRNVLWLNAGEGLTLDGTLVSEWADQSGNGLVATGTGALRPTFNAANGNLNGQPSLSFADANGGYLSIPNNKLLDDGNGFSFFMVLRAPASGGTFGVMNKRAGVDNEQAYRFYQNGGSFITNIASSANNSLSFDNSTNYVLSSVYDGTLAGNKYAFFSNSTNTTTAAGPTAIGDFNSDFFIGNFNTGDTRQFPGDIAEIIVFKTALNPAQRIILENFLSLKYNINIGGNTYFNNSAGYVHDLTGIGTTNGISKQSTPTRSTGALWIAESGNTLNNPNEFLFTAHSNISHNAAIMSNLGEPEIESRWARDYFLHQTRNGVDDAASIEVTLSFDFDEAGLAAPGLANQYVLLYRDTDSGDFNRVFSTITKVGNQIKCTLPSTLAKTGYYTLGIGDPISAQTWYSYQTGNWSNPNTWTLDGSVAPAFINPSSSIPGEFDKVVITNGREVFIDINDQEITGITVQGVLDLQHTHGHDFKEILGRGVIKMPGWDHDSNPGTPHRDNFPAGVVTDLNGFANQTNGGVLEIYGDGIILDQPRTFRDVRIVMEAGTNIAMLMADYTITHDFNIIDGTFQINDGSSTSALRLDVLRHTRVENNGRITVGTANARHSYYFHGNFTNNGNSRFSQRTTQVVGSEATDGIVDAYFVNPSANQSVHCNAPTYFYRIVIDKGVSDTYILDINATAPENFVLTGRANMNIGGDVTAPNQNMNALGLINGTVRLRQNVDVDPLNNTGNYSIGTNARLWIDGGSAIKTGGAAVTPYGTLEISAGTLTITSNSGITTRGTGLFRCSGGETFIPQFRTSIFGDDQVGGFVQTGGTVNVGRFTGSDAANNNYYTFSLTYEDNTFTMTGGTLNVKDASNRGLIFINCDPGGVNVSGGTVNAESSLNNLAKISSRAPFYNFNAINSTTSNNANARLAVVTGSSGSGGESRTINNPNLTVLNDFTLQAGVNRTTSGNTYGTYMHFCSGGDCGNLTVGRNLTIEDFSVLDIWSGVANNAGSSTVKFNGAENAVLYIGDITAITDAFVGYDDPEGVDAFPVWEHPFYNVIIDKPNAVLSLQAKNPGVTGNTADIKTGAGGKNVTDWRTNIMKVVNQFRLENGTLDQMDSRNISYTDTHGTFNIAYSLRLYVNDIFLNGTLFTYEDGVSPKNASVRFRRDAGTINVTASPTSSIGNVRLNLNGKPGGDFLNLNTDLYVKRMEFRHGKVNLFKHQLKIDILDINLLNDNAQVNRAAGTRPVFDNNNIFMTSGNASDGGLALKWPRNVNLNYPEYWNNNNGYNQDNLLWFPLGPNRDPDPSRMNMAVVYFHDDPAAFGDEGYVVINLAEKKLETANLGASDGDMLNLYWRVRFEGFENEKPEVTHIFQYQNSQAEGNQNNYLPGYVLDGTPFTRGHEEPNNIQTGGNTGENGQMLGNDPRNVLLFSGNEMPAQVGGARLIENNGTFNWDGFPGDGFELRQANYTAGAQAAFIGSPTVYYNKTKVGGGVPWTGTPWTALEMWTLDDSHTGPDAGSYPQAGDVAVLANPNGDNNPRHYIRCDADCDAAEVIFDDQFGGWGPRLLLNLNVESHLDKVSGSGGQIGIFLSTTSADNPLLISDLGEFNNGDNNQVIFFPQNGAGIHDVPANLTEFPNVRVHGSGGGFRQVRFVEDAMINGNLRIDVASQVTLNNGDNGDLTIKQTLQLGPDNNGGRFVFPANGTSRRIQTQDVYINPGGQNNYINIAAGGTESVIHQLIVNGNIYIQNSGSAGYMDLYTNMTGGANVELHLEGEGENWFLTDNTSTNNELYRLYMNKGSSPDQTFTMYSNFPLSGPTDQVEKALEILNGTLVLDQADIDYTLSSGGGNFFLPNTANPASSSGSGALEIIDGTVRVSGNNTGIILDGPLKISGGTLDMDDPINNGNNFIEYSTSGKAELEITDGTVLIGSQVRRSLTATTGTLRYIQSGGNVVFGTRNASASPSRGVLEIMNLGSRFEHTGGDLTFVNSNNSAIVPSLRLEPETHDVSNSTITFANTTGNTNMGIKSAIPLQNIVLDGENSPTVKLYELPLTLTGDLTIDLDETGNDIFDANGLDLTFTQGDLINNGTYVTHGNGINNQKTSFVSTGGQLITGNGETVFWRLEKSGTGVLSLEKDVEVSDNLRILGGTFATEAYSALVRGHVLNDAVHTSSTGEGIVMAGTFRQKLERSTQGTSHFGTLTIDNPFGVIVEDETFYTFQVNNLLALRQGVLDISSNLFIIGPDGNIVNAFGQSGRNDFNVNNMVQTNSAFQDFGLRKIFRHGQQTDFVYPVGQMAYTPLDLTMYANLVATNGSTASLTVRPSNEPHPTVNDHDNTGANSPGTLNDRLNVLQYHWILKSDGITNLTADMVMHYDQSAVSLLNPGDATATVSFTEANYTAARLLFSGNVWDKVYDGSTVDEVNNLIIFSQTDAFPSVGDELITGDYTAGLMVSDDGVTLLDIGAFPNTIAEYESQGGGGSFDNAPTWNPLNGSPALAGAPLGAILYIRAGDEVTINTPNARIYRTIIDEGGTFEVNENSPNARLGIIQGTGTIKISSNTQGVSPQLPAGYYEDFLSPDCTGGRLEYAGSVNYKVLAGVPYIREVVFSGSGNREFPDNNLIICENLILREDVQVTNLFARDISVRGDVIKSDNSISNWGSLFSGRESTLILDGNSPQQISGDFTGSSAIYQLRLNNGQGATIINEADPTNGISVDRDVEISNELVLQNGLMNTNNENNLRVLLAGQVSGGGINSFINGPLVRVLSSGSNNYRMPIGDTDRYGYMEIVNPSGYAGSKDWKVQYFDEESTNDIGSVNPADDIEKASATEYWRIETPSPAQSAVRLSWDDRSDVQTTVSNLRIVWWDDSNDYWTELPNTLEAANGVPTGTGYMTAGNLSYSTKFVTWGTIDEEFTPLPITLMYFKGEVSGDQVNILWATANEKNNDYFEVMRSEDGKNFYAIGKVQGQGDTRQVVDYKLEDKKPIIGTSYYMLKQVDFDGSFEYTDVITIDFNPIFGNSPSTLMVYPNPSDGRDIGILGEHWASGSRVELMISNLTGHQVFRDILPVNQTGNFNQKIDLPTGLPTGIYIVTIHNGNKSAMKKLLVH